MGRRKEARDGEKEGKGWEGEGGKGGNGRGGKQGTLLLCDWFV